MDKDYITEYSYGILETFNLFIPRFMGGGNAENVGKDSESYKFFRSLGASPVQATQQVERTQCIGENNRMLRLRRMLELLLYFYLFLHCF